MGDILVNNTNKNDFATRRPLLRADTIYLYMGSQSRVSRSTRVQWLIEHLDAVITIPNIESLDKVHKVIEIVSVIPEEHGLVDWKPDTSHLFQYYVHPNTQLYFLSRRYCLIYCLDMSPSLSTVDIQNGEVMTDKVLTCLKTSLEGVSKPFVLPGSTLVFHPEIYVTIIANTPFFTTPAQQVLVQGWHITSDNLLDLFRGIQSELLKLENAVAKVSQIHVEQLEARRMENENIVGGLFEEGDESTQTTPTVAMVNPDQGFINMLRFGMLALRLLPAASYGSIIVVTDGVITLPDAHLLEATLNRFRTTGVCCSFLHVGSPYHPHGAQARVPYSDLMQFVASASLGVHMTNIPEATILDFRDLQMNLYHKSFLSWSFQNFDKIVNSCVPFAQWFVNNPSFCAGQDLQILRKKHLEDTLNVPLVKLLCSRIREGYTIKNINLTESHIKIKLVLAWKHHVDIEYVIRSTWPPVHHSIHYTLFIQAPYDFLHDILCDNKKPFQSSFRHAVVVRFWNTLKTLRQSDLLLVHLHSQESNTSWSTIPETIKSGMPLFYLTTNVGVNNSPVVTTNDVSNPQFAQFWKPISLLDPDAWHKWLHTHRIGMILRHDLPIPKNLHLSNPSGRYQIIQCRQAVTSLQSYLRNMTTFVLVDNQSFVKLITPDDNNNAWFYIIRITCKPPCVVLNIAFPCGISSATRLKIVNELKTQLCDLSCPTGLSTKERRLLDRDLGNEHTPVTRTSSKVKCCLVLQKPVEKILIRYERMPSTFDTVVFPDGTQPSISAKPLESGKAGYLVTTLSRYLHHKRWIWSAQCHPGSSFGTPGIARILSTITKIRLEEGFSFSHSHAGIVNMLLEVQMKGDPSLSEEVSRCVLQYVVFPPHVKFDEDRVSGDGESDDDEGDGMLQIVTESWVEPHCGFVLNGPPRRSYMDQLPYNKLSDAIANIDFQCISSMLTFEHLNLMTRNKNTAPPTNISATSQLQENVIVYSDGVSISDERINYVPFPFNLLNILPYCRQAELLFSMPIQDLTSWQGTSKLTDNKETNPDLKNSSLMELIYDQLSKLHNRELHLTQEDSKHFVHHLHRRERGANVHPVPIPKYEEDDDGNTQVPGWRCYIKNIEEDHITLTFIPASYTDLKTLMVINTVQCNKPLKSLLQDNNIGEYVDWNRRDQSSGSLEQNPTETMESFRNSCNSFSGEQKVYQSTPVNETVQKKTMLSPVTDFNVQTQSSLDSLIHASNNAVYDTPTSGSSQPETIESSDSSLHRVFNAMTKPYRVRASSLDTNFGRTPRRNLQIPSLRTTSMEAKIWGNRSVDPSTCVSETSGVTRSNTQASEYSVDHIDKSSNIDTNSEDIGLLPTSLVERNEVQENNKIFTTIPLPIFIFDCPLNNVIDTIIYKDNKVVAS